MRDDEYTAAAGTEESGEWRPVLRTNPLTDGERIAQEIAGLRQDVREAAGRIVENLGCGALLVAAAILAAAVVHGLLT